MNADSLAGLTGRGVRVAVIDSGINAAHAHITRVTAGVGFLDDGIESDDWIDRLGHGTAVAAAIQDLAPDVELVAVKIFRETLAARAETLARAISWSADRGARAINLSLGTRRRDLAGALEAAVRYARTRGAVVVAARDHDGEPWYPGHLAGVVPVRVDWACRREEYRVSLTPDGPVFYASGFPRDAPGVPREKNLKGISFAVANMTGFVARALEARPDASFDGLMEVLSTR